MGLFYRTLFLLLFPLAIAACSSGEDGEPGPCTDGIDNDGDGFVDCDDPSCVDSQACGGGGPGVYLATTQHFPDTLLGCTRSREASVVNSTSSWVWLDDVTCASPAGDFSVGVDSITTPLMLLPGASHTFILSFQPQMAGLIGGSVRVQTDHSGYESVEHPLDGRGLVGERWTDSFVGASGREIDLLWVMDNSISMGVFQNSIANGTEGVLERLEAEEIDYQIGVVTSDDPALQGSTPIVTPAEADPAGTFAANVLVGTAGSDVEMPLWYGWEALSSPMTDPGGPNEGLVRSSAGLAVIVVTDQDDESGETAQFFIEAYGAIKPDPGDAFVSGISGGATGCSTADAAPLLLEVVSGTGGEDVSICSADWTAAVSPIFGMLSAPTTRFSLTLTPMPVTIEVTVDGALQVAGWSYDPGDNAIVFDAGHVPVSGAQIDVSYQLPAEEC